MEKNKIEIIYLKDFIASKIYKFITNQNLTMIKIKL